MEISVKRNISTTEIAATQGRRDNFHMRNQWIKDRLKKLGRKQIEMAKALGLTPAEVNKMISGLRRIHADEVPEVARYLEMPVATILGLIADPKTLPLNVTESEMPIGPTRVIGEVEAGVFKDALEYEPAEQFDIYVPVDPRYRRMNRAALKVRGPSMNLLYSDGSYVIVVPTIELGEDWMPRTGMRVVVQRTNEIGQIEATLKEIQINADGSYWLVPKSSDPEFSTAWRMPNPADWNGDHEEHADGIRITALVIGFYRQEG